MDYSDDCLRALGDLAHDTADEYDAGAESPLYAELRGLEDRYAGPELIGAGGMKRIFRVLDKKSHRYVAMARLHEGATELLYDPFIREARLTALLEHPNVISVHDVGIDVEGIPYFTMELKIGDGMDDVLRQTVAGNGKTLTERLEIFLKVADAIAFAHSRKVLHLDLKPANVQVGRYGEVLVCDWGLGKFIGDADDAVDDILLNPDLLGGKTMSGKIKGTPGYMAPEQIRGEAKDERTDVYALGALLYATLTCRPPLEGDTTTILDTAALGEIVPPTTLDARIPHALSAIVMKAMALDPKERYQSVEALQQDIRAYLNGFSPVAQESSSTRELLLFYRRRRTICNAVAVAAAVVLGVTAFFVGRLNEQRRTAENWAREAELQAQVAEAAAGEATRAATQAREAQTLAEASSAREKALADRLRIEKEEHEELLTLTIKRMAPARAPRAVSSRVPGAIVAYKEYCLDPVLSHRQTVFLVQRRLRQLREGTFAWRGARAYLGREFLIATEFEKAQPYLDSEPDWTDLAHKNRILSESFDHQRHANSASELIKLFELLRAQPKPDKRAIVADMALAYDFETLGYRSGYPKACELTLRIDLRKWAGPFQFDEDSRTITIGGKNLTRLTSIAALSPFRYLKPKRLVVNDSSVSRDTDLLSMTDLEVADLRGTRIRNFNALTNHPSLKTLIVRPGQMHPRDKDALTLIMAIVEK